MKKISLVLAIAAIFGLAFGISQIDLQPKNASVKTAKLTPPVPAAEAAAVEEEVPGIYPEASTRILKEEDVDDLWVTELRIMRNEIYARHGYIFNNTEMKEYFADQAWYEGISVNVDDKITPIEDKNIDLIKLHEEYQTVQEEEFMYYGR